MSGVRQAVVCQFCGKVFSKKSNYNRHIKVMHGVDEDGEKLTEIKIMCSLCGKAFANKFTLHRHLDVKHSSDQPHSKVYECDKCNYRTRNKQNFKRHATSCNPGKKSFSCSLCDARYTNERGVKRHKRKVHFSKNINKSRRTCPICKFTSTERSPKEIYSHFENTHEIELEWEKHNFMSITEFKKWKEEVEISTTTSFVKLATNNNVHIYRCHRCGIYKYRGANKRKSKMMKSCKIDGYCPARMIVKVKQDDDIDLSFLKSHVGHENELEHKRLSQEERKSIAVKLALNVPADQILKEVRSTLSGCGRQRIHLINKKDIRNIKKSFNLGEEAVKLSITTKVDEEPLGIAAESNVIEDVIVEDAEELIETNIIFSEINSECEEHKGKFEDSLQNFLNYIANNVHNMEELNFARNHFASLLPTLEDMRKSQVGTTSKEFLKS